MDQKLTTKQDVMILVLGSPGVGKTCLVRRFCDDVFFEGHPSSTCGLDIEVKTIKIQEEEVSLKIWDSAGQERHSDILPSSYFQKLQGVLLVYSINERKSFEKVRFWMNQVYEKAPQNVIKVLVASKCDSKDIEVSTEEGVRLAEKYRMKFVKTSSKKGIGVDKPFYMIAEEFLEQRNNESTCEKTIIYHLDMDEIKTSPLQRPKKCQPCCFLC